MMVVRQVFSQAGSCCKKWCRSFKDLYAAQIRAANDPIIKRNTLQPRNNGWGFNIWPLWLTWSSVRKEGDKRPGMKSVWVTCKGFVSVSRLSLRAYKIQQRRPPLSSPKYLDLVPQRIVVPTCNQQIASLAKHQIGWSIIHTSSSQQAAQKQRNIWVRRNDRKWWARNKAGKIRFACRHRDLIYALHMW